MGCAVSVPVTVKKKSFKKQASIPKLPATAGPKPYEPEEPAPSVKRKDSIDVTLERRASLLLREASGKLAPTLEGESSSTSTKALGPPHPAEPSPAPAADFAETLRRANSKAAAAGAE